MGDGKISGVLSRPLERLVPGSPRAKEDPLGDFKKILSNSLESTDRTLKEADQSTQEMILGKQDIHQTMIALERANLSLRLMVQVRNKMMTAYDEIMRMQF
jgi:flagellar hook-basal body complex protein FliE